MGVPALLAKICYLSDVVPAESATARQVAAICTRLIQDGPWAIAAEVDLTSQS